MPYLSALEEFRKTLQPFSVRVSNDVLTSDVTIVVDFLWYTPDGGYVPLDENVHLCGLDAKMVTHSGRRSQLLLSAMRYGHPSSYIGSSVDRVLSVHIYDVARNPVCRHVQSTDVDDVDRLKSFVRPWMVDDLITAARTVTVRVTAASYCIALFDARGQWTTKDARRFTLTAGSLTRFTYTCVISAGEMASVASALNSSIWAFLRQGAAVSYKKSMNDCSLICFGVTVK